MRNPIKVTFKQTILEEGREKSLVRSTYIATFEDGSVEKIEKTKDCNTDLVTPSDLKTSVLPKETCALYYCEKWSKWGDAKIVRGKDSAATYRKQSPMPARFAKTGTKVVANPSYSAGEQVQKFLRDVQNWADYNMASVEDETYKRMKEAARNVSYAFSSWRINSKQMAEIMSMTTVAMFNLIYKLHISIDFLNQESVSEYINNKNI